MNLGLNLSVALVTFQASCTFRKDQLERVVDEPCERLSPDAPRQATRCVVQALAAWASPGNSLECKFSGSNPPESESLNLLQQSFAWERLRATTLSDASSLGKSEVAAVMIPGELPRVPLSFSKASQDGG